MKLVNTSKRIPSFPLTIIAKLLTVFEPFDAEAEALRSFESRDTRGETLRRTTRRSPCPRTCPPDSMDCRL